MTNKIIPISILIAYKTIKSKQQLWFQKRQSLDSMSGLLEFPGGKIEAGESPSQACIREVSEEAQVSLNLTDIRLMQSFFFEHKLSQTLNIHVFLFDDTIESKFSESGYICTELLQGEQFASLPNNEKIIKETIKYFQEFTELQIN